MIDILLVDDQALLCEVLKTWLDVEQDLQVVGVAHDGEAAIQQVEKLQPDIVLMDIDMPQMDGLNATKIISQRFPQVKTIFLSGHDDDAYLGKSFKAGAKGYLLKNTTAEELVQKIYAVYNDTSSANNMENSGNVDNIQFKLEELIETYRQKFQNQIAEYKQVIESLEQADYVEQQYEKRLDEIESRLSSSQTQKISELETRNQTNWESIRKEIIHVNSQFNQANRNLSLQFNQQINHLKQDLDEKLTGALEDWSRQRAALQEWAVQRDEMRPSMEEYESRSRHELMTIVNPMRASFRDVDKQLKKMRTWAIASGIVTLLALGISGYLLIAQVSSGDFPFSPTEENVN